MTKIFYLVVLATKQNLNKRSKTKLVMYFKLFKLFNTLTNKQIKQNTKTAYYDKFFFTW